MNPPIPVSCKQMMTVLWDGSLPVWKNNCTRVDAGVDEATYGVYVSMAR
jgi:hypothetical protein